MIYQVTIDNYNGQATVADDRGNTICRVAPFGGNVFTGGQVDETAREVHLQVESGGTAIFDLHSGAMKGWA